MVQRGNTIKLFDNGQKEAEGSYKDGQEGKHLIDEFLTTVLGVSRRQVMNRSKCSFCSRPDLEFRDGHSRKEYETSGLCQRCQDLLFKKGGTK